MGQESTEFRGATKLKRGKPAQGQRERESVLVLRGRREVSGVDAELTGRRSRSRSMLGERAALVEWWRKGCWRGWCGDPRRSCPGAHDVIAVVGSE